MDIIERVLNGILSGNFDNLLINDFNGETLLIHRDNHVYQLFAIPLLPSCQLETNTINISSMINGEVEYDLAAEVNAKILSSATMCTPSR